MLHTVLFSGMAVLQRKFCCKKSCDVHTVTKMCCTVALTVPTLPPLICGSIWSVHIRVNTTNWRCNKLLKKKKKVQPIRRTGQQHSVKVETDDPWAAKITKFTAEMLSLDNLPFNSWQMNDFVVWCIFWPKIQDTQWEIFLQQDVAGCLWRHSKGDRNGIQRDRDGKVHPLHHRHLVNCPVNWFSHQPHRTLDVWQMESEVSSSACSAYWRFAVLIVRIVWLASSLIIANSESMSSMHKIVQKSDESGQIDILLDYSRRHYGESRSNNCERYS